MTLEEMITNYIALRDKKKSLADDHKKVLEKYNTAMTEIETYLQGYLQQNNLQNLACKDGTAFLKTKRSATIADRGMFREFIISSKNFDMADFSANVEAVEDYVKDPTNGGNLPPGVNFSTFVSVGIQRK